MPQDAKAVPASERIRPSVPWREASKAETSGQKTRTIPPRPQTAPATTPACRGARNRTMLPRMFMTTIVEKATATRPVVRYWLPR